ncbi:RecQ family ATP-dependent DNA helicase [Pseudochryseolinea flava]|uniref:ATP-dependent DNA helicase RecQ n=1 Tax=Pseudochryseolinea flava TaxID=2059302 RepID=A0A364Y5D0_9BACT|nr:ATP-dependent DNA helicase RecQ [Pseudochryseolinea flava]RAW01027.1 RecQ family ATP-dependent DNA helicase [Pseudochryseolinea flava]
MSTPIDILKAYWKHNQFRPLQEDIVTAAWQGIDTLALLPTGGGKSVCFQVPALLREGVCVVISPLIALMKDQVEQLKSKGILAVAIHSGLSRHEIDVLLDNCVYGEIKFLYVSPERLLTEIFIERFKRMKVALIAIDEAHCISQWGYDFRPPYMKIAALRNIKPDVPFIALTASATEQVKQDIIARLQFKEPFKTFQKSFARDNLSFVVRKTENKERKMLEILQKVKGTAIVYVRSRKGTQDIAQRLQQRGISASYYHAGLSFEERSKRQEDWIKNKTRVIVSTNAFGMGIDKPDVRTVIHLDLPENMESYYQEAGRAGRDGEKAYAAILYQDADVINLQFKTEQSQPSPEVLKRIYQSLANYFQLAMGSAEGESFDFDLVAFTDRFNDHPAEVYVALKKLEEEGLIQFNESFYNPSHLRFSVDKGKLYEFQIASAKFDPVIKMLLRLYGGEMFSEFVKISETYIARALNISTPDAIAVLKHLHELKVVHYEPVKDKPQITFILPRQDAARLPLNLQRLEERKKLIMGKMNAMVEYVTQSHRCRMQLIQDYFNEETFATCGVCDVCVSNKKKESHQEVAGLQAEVLRILKRQPITVEELEELIAPPDHELFVDVVRDMVDEGKIVYDDTWQLRVKG